MKLNLLDNSYIFINESIVNVRRSKKLSQYWAFAILHLIQGLELLMKYILELEHSILIYENIDNPRNTVNIAQALERLMNIASIDIDEKELKIIRRAVKQRNKIVHHEYELNQEHMKAVYSELFEFIHYFHFKHLGGELHDHIDQKLRRTEAELLAEFREGWVTYRGQTLPSYYPLDIVAGQRFNGLRVGKKGSYTYFKRYRYGSEPNSEYMNLEKPCGDCAVKLGELHIPNCDLEICPICCQQFISCNCEAELWIVTEEQKFEPRQINLEHQIKKEYEEYFKKSVVKGSKN